MEPDWPEYCDHFDQSDRDEWEADQVFQDRESDGGPDQSSEADRLFLMGQTLYTALIESGHDQQAARRILGLYLDEDDVIEISYQYHHA